MKLYSTVANTKHKTIGIIIGIYDDTRGDCRTDADGMVPFTDLELYDKDSHKDYHMAPSTREELDKREYNIKYNVGTVKYLVCFHNGRSTHKDGSAFYDIRSFKNKKKMDLFIKELKQNNYR